MSEQKTYYRRHLPHYQPPFATYHVVFRVVGSLPLEVIEQLKQDRLLFEKRFAGIENQKHKHDDWSEFQKSYFEKFDSLLDTTSTSLRWLAEPKIAAIVDEAIHHRDQKEFDLFAYCIMPNHVHLIIDVSRNGIPTNNNDEMIVSRNTIPTYSSDNKPLYKILQSLKRHTARQSNILLNRSGALWQDESYDHVIRDPEELEQTIWYVLNNPVKAQLVASWEQWKWSYCKFFDRIANRSDYQSDLQD